jgi:hypothetical protein
LSTRESLVAQAKEIAGNVANTNVRVPTQRPRRG